MGDALRYGFAENPDVHVKLAVKKFGGHRGGRQDQLYVNASSSEGVRRQAFVP